LCGVPSRSGDEIQPVLEKIEYVPTLRESRRHLRESALRGGQENNGNDASDDKAMQS
jgi:hypothetical protein